MDRYLVIGDPIAHSRSPGMQNAAFRFHNLDARYEKRHVLRGEIAPFLEEARRELAGFNLTIPHKGAVIEFLDEITPEAAAAGSVNTVTVRDGKLLGDSTDGYGLEHALLDNFHLGPAGKKFLFLGCGGAARATAFHLALRGAETIRIANRTIEKAEALADELRRYRRDLAVEISAIGDEERLAFWLADTDFLIQATSLGLRDDDAMPLNPELLTPKLAVRLRIFDTIYRDTPILRRAVACSIPAAGGMEMLIHQGAKSFEIWTGLPAPLDVMRRGFLQGDDESCCD